jgi:hypothetical protein
MTRDDGSAGEIDALGPRALREWVTGERDAYSHVFLVERGVTRECVDQVGGDRDAVLLPEGSGPYEGAASVIRYNGALDVIGDELYLGDRGVELQDYVAAGFVHIIGPTVVCLDGAHGWQAFFDDAELTRRTGVFPSALIDPRVLLADRIAFARPLERETPNTFRVRADGSVGIGVRGEVIGGVDDLPRLLATPFPRSAVLAGLAPDDVIANDLTSRGWIDRYLSAIDLMKMLRVGNGEIKISEFGWSLIRDGLADAEPMNADPFLIEVAEGYVLADTGTLRRHLLSPTTAIVVAATQTSSTIELAAERLSRLLGVPVSEAKRLCREAVAALRIQVGRLAAPPRQTAVTTG